MLKAITTSSYGECNHLTSNDSNKGSKNLKWSVMIPSIDYTLLGYINDQNHWSKVHRKYFIILYRHITLDLK